MAQTIVLRNNPAYKEGSLLGYDLNSQSRFNPVPITLSRDSEAYVEKNGVLTRVNPEVPRIDSDGALLVEPQRTNLVTYSEQFDNAAWTKTNATISANATTAPDGATTADELIEDSATSTHFIQQSVSVSATNYTMSCFVKYNSSRNWVYLNQGGANARAYFDIQNGVVGTTTNAVSASITNYGNGWYRCDLVATQPSATSRVFLVGLADSDNSDSYLGDGTSGVFAWGAQVEAGSYATSYIKTEGATATRSADVVSQTGLANLLGDAEGSLYVEASVFTTNNQGRISLNNGSTVNRVTIDIFTQFRSITTVASSNVAIISGGSVSPNTFYKVAVRYAVNDFAIYEGGSSISTDTSGSTFSDGTLTNLSFNDGSTGDFYGKIKALAVYDTALDNTELANITTNGI